jgi:hypothetical protein
LKYNYISIPRTASQSLHNSLGRNKHENHIGWRKLKNKNLFTFAFIREPIQRLESWFWFHKKKYKRNPQIDASIYKGTFQEWVNRDCTHHWSEKACEDLGIGNPLLQWDFVSDGTKVMPVRLLRFSHLEEDLESVREYTGGHRPLKVSGHSHRPAEKHSDETIYKLMNLFKKDFELYATINSDMPSDQ